MSGSTRTRHAPKPRPASRATSRPAPIRATASPLSGWRRWRWVAILVIVGLIGLPLAHAILGEVAALLGAIFLLGFLMGRWTAG
ncbi:hypothetical protein [Roseicella aerolata]|uniref:Uncharacterized protein n=1 Tax=Roseicella aerolata TaxID=2883479 RepID=A0A9X1ICI7_9PROT|nr:hypothetical protein [Roseicella aerolata]MCB4820520.1 hypothetical protein [Roseicella aerolata]